MARRTKSSPPERGDHVEIVWADVCSDGRSDPDEVELFKWEPHLGRYYGERTSHGVECVILVTTMPTDENRLVGVDIFPKALIISMKVTKRIRRHKKEPTHANPPVEPPPV